MGRNLYRETFSHVRSSYEFRMEDFEGMKRNTGSGTLVRRAFILIAAAALLAALAITAYATELFGLRSALLGGGDGLISMQGYMGSPEYMALEEYYSGALTLEEAAEKYGLRVEYRCEIYDYEQMSELLGGELTDRRNTRYSFCLYGDGTFSSDQSFTGTDGTEISYQLFRSVKGSLIDISLNAAGLGEEYEERTVRIGSTDVCLVLGSHDRSLIIADLGESFLAVNVLSGMEADPVFGGPITGEELEELAKSLNWSVLSRVAVPEFPTEEQIKFGPGVELDPEYIDPDQSFPVTLPYWGETNFITYLATPGFGDVRFFLSRDGQVSDCELHPFFNEVSSAQVAAVSFRDFNADGQTDILALIDYVSAHTGKPWREARLFICGGDGEFEPESGINGALATALADTTPDVAAVLAFCEDYYSHGPDIAPADDRVIGTLTLREGDLALDIQIWGRQGNYGYWGVREVRVYVSGESEPLQILCPTDAGEDYAGGIYDGYTSCPDAEEAVTALDMNFDGYTDLGLFGWTPNNTIPYYYFFWDQSRGMFRYAITLQGAEVYPERRQVVECFKSGDGGSEYTYNYYEPDGNGDLVLADTRVEKYGDWVEANDYAGMLGYLQSLYTDTSWLTYALYDLTGNGTPELFATFGTCEADFECAVFSMDTGKMRRLGTFSLGHSVLYLDGGRLLRLTGQMGCETVTEIGFDGDGVTEKELSARKLGPEEDYTTFPDRLELTPDTDLTRLHGAESTVDYAGVLGRYSGCEYTLFDLDADGTPELIVNTGTGYAFWTGLYGSVFSLGELDVRGSLREGEGHDLRLYCSNMSGAEISRIYRDGDGIATLYLTGWEWKEGVSGEDPGRELEWTPLP